MGEVSTALQGALRLARLDPRGMAFFDRSVTGFWHSYRAALIGYPIFLALLVFFVPAGDADTPGPDWFHILLVETICYAINWVAFALLMLPVSRYLGREARWIDYIVAYNWSQIPQLLVQLAAMMIIATGLAPAGPVILVQAAVLLLYGGFIARVALDISRTAATMIVLMDFTLGVFLGQLAQALH
jgi:hypothetical protein